jgi:hypothetical protein
MSEVQNIWLEVSFESSSRQSQDNHESGDSILRIGSLIPFRRSRGTIRVGVFVVSPAPGRTGVELIVKD